MHLDPVADLVEDRLKGGNRRHRAIKLSAAMVRDDDRVAAHLDGDLCIYGEWYVQSDEICFAYENDPAPACWLYFLDDGRIRGRYMGEGGGWEIVESERGGGPLPCAGPDVGV